MILLGHHISPIGYQINGRPHVYSLFLVFSISPIFLVSRFLSIFQFPIYRFAFFHFSFSYIFSTFLLKSTLKIFQLLLFQSRQKVFWERIMTDVLLFEIGFEVEGGCTSFWSSFWSFKMFLYLFIMLFQIKYRFVCIYKY